MVQRKKIFWLFTFLMGLLLSLALYSNNFYFNQWRNIKSKINPSVMAQGAIIKGEIPLSIMPCLPRNKSVKKLEIEAQTAFDQKEFYLINVTEAVSSVFEHETDILEQTTVIQEDNIGCLVVIPREKSMKNSMMLYLPASVAKALALNFVERRIELAGGKKAFIQSYNEIPRDAADSPWIFFPEDAWAYEQLGLKLPNPHVIVNTWDEVETPNPGVD